MSAAETAENAAEKTGNALGKKIGPLPAGVWVALVVGGLGIAWWTRSRGSSTAVEAVVPNSTIPTAGNLGGTVGSDTDTSSGSVQGSLVPGNNETWASMGLARLLSMGVSGVAADQAIRKYLGGDQLDSTETTLIDRLLGSLGAPPVSPPLPLSGSVGTSSPIGSGGSTTPTTGTTTPGKDADMPAPVAAPTQVYYGSYTQKDWGGSGATEGIRTVTVSQSKVDQLLSGNISGYTPREAAELLQSVGASSSQIKAATGWG